MSQLLRPEATEDAGNFTVTGAASIHEATDESSLNTADYAESPSAPSGEDFRVRLEAGTDPESTGTHAVHVVAAKSSSGGAQMNMLVELVGSSTGSDVVLASQVFADISSTPTDHVMTLTTSQINAIPEADYEQTGSPLGQLDVRVTFTQI